MIFMGGQSRQEWFRDGFRDAREERLPGTIHKWGPGVELIMGSELRKAGYIPDVQDGDLFVLGNMSPRVQAALEAGRPHEVPIGQWLRHLHDLSQSEFRLVRFREHDDPLSAFANVEDSESALKFVAKFGFPINAAFGAFVVGELSADEIPEPVRITVARPLARVSAIIEEAQLIRTLSRLRDGTRGAAIESRKLQRLEASIRRFANREGLPQLAPKDSLRTFGQGEEAAPELEQVWDLALRVADARFRRVCPPKGSLSSTVASFEPQSILGLIYWMLRRVLVGHGVAQKRCQNPKCMEIFAPSRSSVKYCSESCRRQVSDDRRATRRAKNRSTAEDDMQNRSNG